MDTISFAGDELSAELLPADELADCAATVLERDGPRILSYGTGAGYSPLRELLGEQYGVPPHRVVLTNGWFHGFALLARTGAGQNVVIEYPTYDRVVRLMFSLGCNIIYLDLSPEGPLLELLAANLRTNQRPAFVYTIPTFHNPTGQSLTLDQRGQLLRTLEHYRVAGIEDDSYGLLRYDGEPLPTLFEISGGTSLYSTSFSHTIAPGLRVGVFVLPDPVAVQLSNRATSNYITPALLGQATVFEFIQRGSFETHVTALVEELAERRDAMLDALTRHVPNATWVRPEGGIFVLITMTDGVDAKQALAGAEGLTAVAGEDFYGRPNTIRLNFAGCARDEIEPGIERLGAALAHDAAG